MTDLLQVRGMTDDITEMSPLKQIEGGQKGICLAFNVSRPSALKCLIEVALFMLQRVILHASFSDGRERQAQTWT
jgi:hypothetical protein